MDQKNLSFDECKRIINNLFRTCSCNDINFVWDLLETIIQCQEPNAEHKLFQLICEAWEKVNSSKESPIKVKIDDSEYDHLKSIYGQTVNSILELQLNLGISRGWSSEDFYLNLWKSIKENELFANFKTQVFALYFILVDNKIPYHNIEKGQKMSETEYQQTCNELYDQIMKFKFINNLDFMQRSEKAASILNLINNMKTEKEKIVFLSRIIAYYEDELDKLKNKIYMENNYKTIILITALEDEYNAVCTIFGKEKETFKSGLKYCSIKYKIKNINIKVIIIKQYSMGMISASSATTYAIHKFKPQMILMCGVCAGVNKEIQLGDLIVFTPVFDYECGKYIEGKFYPDFRHHQIDGKSRGIVEKMRNDKLLKRKIKDGYTYKEGTPVTELNIHVCQGATGSAVIADPNKVEGIAEHQRSLSAIDMESYAVAEIASIASEKKIPWLVVKGVQDHADSLKSDKYRNYAAYTSAVFMKEFLNEYFSNND